MISMDFRYLIAIVDVLHPVDATGEKCLGDELTSDPVASHCRRPISRNGPPATECDDRVMDWEQGGLAPLNGL